MSTRANGADFAGAAIYDTTLAGAQLLAANFDGALLAGADFAGADLGLASFRGAVLLDAKWDGANLKSADFDGAVVFGPDALSASRSRRRLTVSTRPGSAPIRSTTSR